MLKQEYPWLLKSEAAKAVGAKTFRHMRVPDDPSRRRQTRHPLCPGRTESRLPDARSSEGAKHRLSIAGSDAITSRHNGSAFEKCAAIDGTWGLKQQYFDLSLKVAEPLLREIREGQPDLTVSDCSLAGLQIQQAAQKKPLHPVQVLEIAYGLAEESRS
jgi:glycerol-3-phosphate dehydrogenase subunit C